MSAKIKGKPVVYLVWVRKPSDDESQASDDRSDHTNEEPFVVGAFSDIVNAYMAFEEPGSLSIGDLIEIVAVPFNSRLTHVNAVVKRKLIRELCDDSEESEEQHKRKKATKKRKKK